MWGALAGARFSGLGEDRDVSFRHIAVTMAAAAAAVATPALAQTAADDARFRAAQERFERELETFRSEYDRYQSVRRVPGSGYRTAPADPRYDDPQWRDEGDYDPSRYYSPGNQERALGPNDRVYTGSDGRYYCRRSDGTTGLIVGGALGGVLGNVIDGGRSRTVGTLLGGAAGALAGRAVDRSNQQIRCR